MRITLLLDDPKNWFDAYKDQLASQLRAMGHTVSVVYDHVGIKPGEIAFFLNYTRLVAPEILARNEHNIVVHESKLPAGKGFAPLSWQILEGKNVINLTLFEATDKPDEGAIYLRDSIKFSGHELNADIRRSQAEKTIEMVLKYVRLCKKLKGKSPKGKASWYPRRRPENSELDINRSIREQFNLLRIVDNERYPAFFKYRGHTYILKIFKK